ncbi:GNAT family N-acetyltransferase [Lacrimispora sp.]|uniref:GNAT family N-acetyltransferase n=1 Tax=Lacrimispora sp. TaxID=2719234 RepID=UPI0028AF77DC|nr:GNAT family N-acetyltransferase [Lacrimispora sp.]
MKLEKQEYCIKGLKYTIRSAEESDAAVLAKLRVLIDGETEHMDREAGEGLLDENDFKQLIMKDTRENNHLFLVALVNETPIGFSRCEGSPLKRMAHKVMFGVCVQKKYWGHQIGRNLLSRSMNWADANGIKKVELGVLETNRRGILLYMDHGFKVEGVLRQDKLLSDGNYYDTIIMGRIPSLK